jgi:polysaccharide biosynthesis transport protein
MEIQELWRVISQRWRIVVIVTLLCVSLALAWSFARPVTFKAEGSVTIATAGSLGTAGDAYGGEQVAVQRAPTYAQLLKGPEVAARASQKLHGEISAETIQDSIDAQISSRLPLVVVTAKSRSANDAVQIVSAAEQGLQQYIREIERPGRDGSLTSVVLSGDAPVVSRAGNPVRDTILAALLGLILGIMLAVYRDRTDPGVKSAGQIASRGLVYRGTIKTTDKQPALGEAFRRLAVGCVLDSKLNTGRVLVVGVDSECDTAFIAQGLAHGLVACGRKVTFVDAVTRNGARRHVGFSDVVDGSRSWAECVGQADAGRLWHMGIGTKADWMDGVLIDTKDPKQRLPVCDKKEHIVIAAQSIVHSSVAVALTAVADCVLVVVAVGRSQVADVAEAKMTLDAMGVPVVGMVMLAGEPAARDKEESYVTQPGDASDDETRPFEAPIGSSAKSTVAR